jgi:hypothetical protein
MKRPRGNSLPASHNAVVRLASEEVGVCNNLAQNRQSKGLRVVKVLRFRRKYRGLRRKPLDVRLLSDAEAREDPAKQVVAGEFAGDFV